MKKIILIIALFIIIAIGAAVLFFGWKDNQKEEEREQPKQTNENISEKIMLLEAIIDGCKLRITTSKKVFFIETSVDQKNLPEYKNCGDFIISRISPSEKFVVFQDQIRGETNSETRIYALDENQSFQLDANGLSEIFDMIFLSDDRIIILYGIKGAYNNQYLKIYDIAGIFREYPKNVDEKYWKFTDIEKYSRKFVLPNIGKDYVGLSVSGEKLIVRGPEKVESGIKKEIVQEFYISDLSIF